MDLTASFLSHLESRSKPCDPCDVREILLTKPAIVPGERSPGVSKVELLTHQGGTEISDKVIGVDRAGSF